METCPFYRVERKTLRSRTIGDQQLVTVETPWCAHKHSPVTLKRTKVIGGSLLLACKGDLNRCQVPSDKLTDIEED
jgi:hypothetical protein